MAKAGKFEWDRAGYASVLNSSAVKSVLEKKGSAIARSANAKLRPTGPTDKPYKYKLKKGKLATGVVVRTGGPHSMRAENSHGYLKNSIGAGRR